MMARKNVLLTGTTGFIGSHVSSVLGARYCVCAPTRAELNLLDPDAVRAYLAKGNFDAVVHLANPTANNPVDKSDELFELCLRVFSSLAHCSELYGKFVYIGSGAEYGKHRDISRVKEEAFGNELPRDGYGLARYIMNGMGGDNTINLRLFACWGQGDPLYKLAPHILNCIRRGEPIALRQNALFDFLWVSDVAPVLIHFIEHTARHKAYNLCSGERLWVSEIAEEIKRRLGSDLPVTFENDTPGFEYTGDNERLRNEIPDWRPTAAKEAIRRILANEDWKP